MLQTGRAEWFHWFLSGADFIAGWQKTELIRFVPNTIPLRKGTGPRIRLAWLDAKMSNKKIKKTSINNLIEIFCLPSNRGCRDPGAEESCSRHSASNFSDRSYNEGEITPTRVPFFPLLHFHIMPPLLKWRISVSQPRHFNVGSVLRFGKRISLIKNEKIKNEKNPCRGRSEAYVIKHSPSQWEAVTQIRS